MSRFRILAVLAMIGVLVSCLSPAQARQPGIEAFVQAPNLRHARLSPDGTRLAFTTEQDGVSVLIVRDLASGEIQGSRIDDLRTHGLRWANDRILLLTASEVTDIWGVEGRVDYRALLAFDTAGGMSYRQLLRRSNRLGLNLNLAGIAGIDTQTGRLMIPAFDDDRRLNLLSVDPAEGTARTAARGSRDTRDWVVDASGQPAARIDYSNNRNRQTLRIPGEGGGWAAIDQDERERPSYSLRGFLPDGRLAVSTRPIPGQNAPDRRSGLFVLSLETGELGETLFEHAQYDYSRTVMDPYTNLVVGVAWTEDFEQTTWFDPDLAARQDIVDASLPGQNARLQSWDRNRTRFVVVAETSDMPPVYYLYDVQAQSIDLLGAAYPDITLDVLQPRQHIRYEARDGVSIEAYLTQPAGEGPFPTVVLPHGGPASRDSGGYDDFAHYLASRGYAVVQPNFRGSSGYGYRWLEAGYGEWGTGVMQHDLSDAVDRLVNAGIADPDRVCIVGASYGGYAALAGLAFTPDLYACGISVAGVSDLPDMMGYVRERYGPSHWILDSWERRLSGSDEAQTQAALRAVSPAAHAERISAPVLLIHGRNDTVVPIDQSRIMERALRRENHDVQLITLDDGDHWLTSTEMRRRVLSEIEAFLAEHIGE